EHGVTYNVYGDPHGMDRPWELDMVPLLVPPSEWAKIEAGLVQRAKLFNLILTDLYGPKKLLKDGFLPPALVYANPHYLRPCHGLSVPRQIYLHLHATDLTRSPDGQWWVISDRTQAPSGAGYTLENRIVLSRVLPDEFRDCNVQRLASFFRIHRDTLRSLAPHNRDNPSVVLLTPGPYNETYFEHDYLARYLGFTLIEGGDLTVRDSKVFIKTLEGLRQVDVILRRVDDSFCDPLELRGDSFLGVAGLVEAARAGNVAIANALGSGVIESPAFMAFLPGLCRQLLGEELKLPSLATWWCGQEKERQYVIDHLDEFVVKPAFGSLAREPYFGAKLAAKERDELITAIRERPDEFVAQEHATLSTAPVWFNGKLEPRPLVMRAYSTAMGDSYAVMPGGLSRVSTAAEEPIVSMQSGGGSKDTWVISDGPVNMVSLLTPSGQLVRSGRSAAELPSRVADNLYWLGRYTERLEGTLRLLRCIVGRMVGEAGAEGLPELAGLTQMLMRLDLMPARFKERIPQKELEHEILLLIYKPDRAGSAKQILNRVRGLASVVRDRFSSDTWSILNKLNIDARSRPHRIPLADALNVLNTAIVDLAAFSGMEMENMTRGLGWRFLDFGRRLERSVQISQFFRASIGSQANGSLMLEPVLEIFDSLITYRRRYFTSVQVSSVLELLLLDEGNPRSLAFQLKALREHAAHLPREANTLLESPEQKRIAGLSALLRNADATKLAHPASSNRPENLDSLLADFQVELGMISTQLTHHYFSHTVASVS
ncbi:MAG TPA: circularly permuted type 2 ATP-grasp protein, partial [Verrucomicrobiae bacterium]|nr:circularly permuted type 2 ATP-grasp protein [Verrucomicrobiae bacterium]